MGEMIKGAVLFPGTDRILPYKKKKKNADRFIGCNLIKH